MNPPNLKGDGWYVRPYTQAGTQRTIFGVFDPGANMLSENACLACVKQAAAGDPDAITAILLCTEDMELQKMIQKLENSK